MPLALAHHRDLDAKHSLYAALAGSLETMAFICCEPRSPQSVIIEGSPCTVSVGFTDGRREGSLRIVTAIELGQQIAEVLVEGGPIEGSAAEDLIKELANVVCGVALKAVQSQQQSARFVLQVPVFHMGLCPDAAEGLPPSAVVELVADGFPVRTELYLSE